MGIKFALANIEGKSWGIQTAEGGKAILIHIAMITRVEVRFRAFQPRPLICKTL